MTRPAPNSSIRSTGPIWRSLWFWSALSTLAALRSWGLDLPLDRDEGEYATLAQQWLRGGGLPYRDFLEQKPPLAIWLNMLAFSLGGESVATIRWASFVWQLATGALLFAWLRRACAILTVAERRADICAYLGVALYALAANGARAQGLLANTETLVALPMLGALFALLPRDAEASASARQWFVAGVCIGIASLAKQVALPALAVLPLFATRGAAAFARAGLAIGAGALLPWVLTALVFAPGAAIDDLWRCLFVYNFSYSAQTQAIFGSRVREAIEWVGPEQSLLWFGTAFALLRSRLLTSAGPLQSLLLAWLVASWLGVFLSGWAFGHYFLLPVPAMAAVCAIALAAQPLGWRVPSWQAAAAALVTLLCLAGWLFENGPVWAADDGPERMRRTLFVESFAQAPAIADAIGKLDAQGSPLWMWGSEPQLFFLTGMRPATRFLFHYPFTGVAPPWPGGEREMLEALRDPRVRVAVRAKGLDRRIPFQAALASELAERFEILETFPGRVHIYRRIAP